MKNPAKRLRLATGLAALPCFVGFAVSALSELTRKGELSGPDLALSAGLGALTLACLLGSAWIERSSERAITPFWMRIKPAYWGSILLTPVAILTLGILLLPTGVGGFAVISLPFGAPAFLCVGAPLAWYALKRGISGPLWGAALGFAANALALPVTALIMLGLSGGLGGAVESALFIHMFGLVFGPLYGATAGLLFDGLYGRDRRRKLGPRAPRQVPGERAVKAA